VQLHVAIFKSKAPEPKPDPVIYLAGGGGANHLPHNPFYLENGGDEILRRRDYIMYNQRGAVLSLPPLECPGYTDLLWTMAIEGLNQDDKESRQIEFLLRCQDILLDQGINLEMYNSAVNAADLNDLRLALGYEQVNLYGTSYGTKLALTAMRDYPEGIRSVILDSVYPLQSEFHSEVTPNINRAFQEVFAGCAADPDCAERYPDLEQTFYRVIQELKANTTTVTLGSTEITIDPGMFSDAIVTHLYSPGTIPRIPRLIDDAGRGSWSGLGDTFAGLLSSEGISLGAHYSIFCREEVAYESYEEAMALGSAYQVWDSIRPSFIFPLCASWKSGIADPRENEAVVSDIPTLIFAGQYDPATPPAWGRMAAETLSNSYFYEFRGLGHGVMRSNRCAQEMGLQFIADPTLAPDASCMEDLQDPNFR
jgi:pimeloyl-ACP methyl ester carboxylesterase